MLELKGLSKHFGGVRAVDGVDLVVAKGEIVGLIGPNGSGKSTTINLICGLFPVTAGTVTFQGRDITTARPHQCVGYGIARTFQNIRLFGQLTVWENLWVARNSAAERGRHGARCAVPRGCANPGGRIRWTAGLCSRPLPVVQKEYCRPY